MKKAKEVCVFIMSIISAVLLYILFKGRNNSEISDETKKTSEKLENDASRLVSSAEELAKHAKLLDNSATKEDEEWYKKR